MSLGLESQRWLGVILVASLPCEPPRCGQTFVFFVSILKKLLKSQRPVGMFKELLGKNKSEKVLSLRHRFCKVLIYMSLMRHFVPYGWCVLKYFTESRLTKSRLQHIVFRITILLRSITKNHKCGCLVYTGNLRLNCWHLS